MLQSLTPSVFKLAKQHHQQILISSSRYISFDKIDNKRILRLESDVEITDDKNFNSRLINRNPRNLEQLSYEIKPNGFWLEQDGPLYWNKVRVQKAGKHLHACLIHWSGKRLVEVSTQELKLAKYFKNTNAQAAALVGKILATRCLQCGYLTAYCDSKTEASSSPIVDSFVASLEETGLVLNESKPIVPRTVNDI